MIIARGEGILVIDGEVKKVSPMDAFIIPGGSAHQLLNAGDGPFGFFCMVNADRDQYKLLTSEEISALKDTPAGGIIKAPYENDR